MTENCTNSNQNQSNLRLKCGKTITIDGKDVQRIRILNDIVWEKTKPTTLTITGTPKSVTIGKTLNLVATLTDSYGEGVNGDIIFSGNGISGTKTIRATNGVATLQKVAPNSVGNNNTQTYTAKFNPTDSVYLPSQATVTISVSKEKPILTIVGETTIYNSWKIGIKLTRSDGKTVLSNQSITVSGAVSKTIKTNSKGIASLTVTGLKAGAKNITFKYAGNNQYQSVSKTQKYTVKDSASKTLEYLSCNLGQDSVSRGTQKWKQNSNTSYQCRNTGETCYQNSVTIATASGTRKTPDLLKLGFKKGDISTITGATFSFNSQSVGEACRGSGQGGWFKTAPTVKLCVNGSTYHKGSGAKTFATKNVGWGNYSAHDVVAQKITWSSSYSVSNNLYVTIQFPSNSGGEEGCLKVSGVKLQVSYIPKQKTSF